MAPGCIAICFIENENGKPLYDLIDDILSAESIKEIQEKNDILQLKYFISVTIASEVDEESLQDLKAGLNKLDKASVEYRISLAKNEVEKLKEQARRNTINLCIKGLYPTNNFAQEFDFCTVDMSEMSIEDIEKNLIHVAELAQHTNPTTYIIPTTLANELEDAKYKETPLGKTFNAKIRLKSVFAPEKDLKNIFVRAI